MYPVLNKYEHKWATVAMIQGNLKNFHGHKRCLAQIADGSGAGDSNQDNINVTTGAEDSENTTPPPPSAEPSPSLQVMKMRSNLSALFE